ncbi:MAG: peptidoglycan DD-metalloendopeptidase family protein [Bacilli bacterium]|nr:peptidoglycan DD-metalloendopeptidase family protein [Bacilli bacterium]
MQNIIKKIMQVFSIIVFIIPTFMSPTKVSAQTLGDLKSELDAKLAELNANKEEQQLTEAQINSINSTIASIKKQIDQTYTDIASLNADIESLNGQIAEKEEQIKQIVNFIQVSNGESSYLEYAFGASDFTDFIYRISVAEQLANYNDQLVDEYNQMIEENKQKQKQIEEKRTNLASQQENLDIQKTKLGQELETLSDTSVDIEDEIQYQKEIIELYKNKGCKDNEDISTCGRKALPAGTAFYRPTDTGYVISEFGARDLLGRNFHEGLDVSVPAGTPVYAIGTGMVAVLMNKNSCGGNMVIVHHNINGQTFTSVYAHLRTITVSQEQIVSRNTIVGYSGGDPSTFSYDACTTGAHLHLTLALGLYGSSSTYTFYYMNNVARRNPRDYINFPSGRTKWEDRLTAY